MANLWPLTAASRIDLAEEPEFRLGGISIKPSERIVLFNGERRELQPRVMQVLVTLAKARPNVVSRDKLSELCWEGRVVGDDALNRCILMLRHLAQEVRPEPFVIETVPRVGHRLVERGTLGTIETKLGLKGIALPIAGALLVLVVALLLTRPWKTGPRTPTVIVMAANDGASRELANDLEVKLGGFEAGRTASMRLLDKAEGVTGKPDLVLEVGRIANPAGIGANLVLKAAPDDSILWSEELNQPSRNLADLKQQVAYTAARILGCATEAMEEGVRSHTLKTYLNGCAALAHLIGDETERVIPMFRKVVQDAPQFEGGWAKLLIADSAVAVGTTSPEAVNRFKADLAATRKAHPNLPEVYLAQAYLLPWDAYSERMRLVDRAIELNPESAGAYAVRSGFLQFVGRMKDSVVDARRAMQLEPLSPDAHGGYIYALSNAGLHGAAIRELHEAERLWPGSRSVAEIRFFFNLRYGDPRQAWQYLRANPSADWMNARSYLEARFDPSSIKIERAVKDAERLYRVRPSSLQHLIQVYGEFDREKDLLELYLQNPDALMSLDFTFRPQVAEFWRDPRALLVAKRAGMLAYWIQSGRWPDFCVAPDLPYDCKAEAEKIAAAAKA